MGASARRELSSSNRAPAFRRATRSGLPWLCPRHCLDPRPGLSTGPTGRPPPANSACRFPRPGLSTGATTVDCGLPHRCWRFNPRPCLSRGDAIYHGAALWLPSFNPRPGLWTGPTHLRYCRGTARLGFQSAPGLSTGRLQRRPPRCLGHLRVSSPRPGLSTWATPDFLDEARLFDFIRAPAFRLGRPAARPATVLSPQRFQSAPASTGATGSTPNHDLRQKFQIRAPAFRRATLRSPSAPCGGVRVFTARPALRLRRTGSRRGTDFQLQQFQSAPWPFDRGDAAHNASRGR